MPYSRLLAWSTLAAIRSCGRSTKISQYYECPSLVSVGRHFPVSRDPRTSRKRRNSAICWPRLSKECQSIALGWCNESGQRPRPKKAHDTAVFDDLADMFSGAIVKSLEMALKQLQIQNVWLTEKIFEINEERGVYLAATLMRQGCGVSNAAM